MKIGIKILIIALSSFIAIEGLSAQEHYILDYSPELLLGKWRATSGSTTYELEFKTEVISRDSYTLELILGKVKYTKNGVITKQTGFNGSLSIISGSGIKSPKNAELNFIDEARKVWWVFEFTIDANNSNTARWKFLRAHENLFGPDWNIDTPDIPDNLTFNKVPDLTVNPGGGS